MCVRGGGGGDGGMRCLLRCIFGVAGHLPHGLERRGHGVLQHARLEGGVEDVLVHTVGRLGGGVHGDALLRSVPSWGDNSH